MTTEIEDNLPPQTAPDEINVNLIGFNDEAYAKELGNTVACALRDISRIIDAERLDGVTIAFDYDQALSTLDRGVPGLHPLKRTIDDHGTGVAMTPAVLRDGIIKSHIVIHADVANMIMNEDTDLAFQAIGLLAHELGHVHDNKYKDISFPGSILKERIFGMDGILHEMTYSCWSEYIATRLSAPFNKFSESAYIEMFTTSLTNCTKTVNAEIVSYRRHADLNKLLSCARLHYGGFLKYASYLIGHLNGTDRSIQHVSQETTRLMQKFHLQTVVNKLETALNNMYSTYGEWSDSSIWDEAKDVCWECLSNGGIVLRTTENGLFVDVPFTPETMP